MRDLTARLREIVRRETARSPAGEATAARGNEEQGTTAVPASPTRELTYVPDPHLSEPCGPIADALGGTNVDAAGACVMIERRYDGTRSHGRRRLDACVPVATAPIGVFDPRVTTAAGWWRKAVFFDIETTGLSGGAGTLAFLVGCGWFDAEGFVVRQFFLAGPAGEKPMLDALRDVFADSTLLVTYNGRTFDVPFMETRWAFHWSSAPTDGLLHFDMLPPARRLWSRRGQLSTKPGAGPTAESDGCSLTALERRVLGFHRQDDVPGFEIPARYFHFLRSGDAAAIEGVLEHNRHDLVSLAVMMAHALWLVEEGPEACRDPGEQIALGRLYERVLRAEDAVRAYEIAAACGDGPTAAHALARTALLRRRQRRFDDAAEAWQRIVDLSPRDRRRSAPLVRRAVEALAIHHEHRVRDLDSARRYADELSASATGRERDEIDRRLQRLERKMQRQGLQVSPAAQTLQYELDETSGE